MGVCVKKSEGEKPSLNKQGGAFANNTLSNEELSTKHSECSNCGDRAPSRMRCFSREAWSVLLLWNEISATTVEKPMCDYCYNELRSILMERMDEFDQAVAQSLNVLEA